MVTAGSEIADSVAVADLENLSAILPQITKRLAETAAEHDRYGTLPTENFAFLHRHGFSALAAPRRLGGGGMDLIGARQVIAAVARGEPATALVLVMQYLLHTDLDGPSGFTEPLKRRVVDDALKTGALINWLRVEPDLGTPARGGLPATVARRCSDGWRLSGRKIFSTGSTALSWMVVLARSDDAEPLVGGWLVPANAPGIRIEETWDHLGLRASASHDVIFEDVFIPLDHALDPFPAGKAPPYTQAYVNWFSVLIAVIYDAIAQSARDWLMKRKPANLGAPLSTLPRFQEAVGAIDGLLLQNRLLLDAASANETSSTEGGLVKYLVTENAIAVVEKAIALTGNPGLSRHNPLERHLRDVLCGRVHTPQGDVVLANSGRAAFAERAS